MSLTPFTYEDQQVRVLDIDGEPEFVAPDVARILGYSEASAMTRTLDDDEKGLRIVQTLGGQQQVTTVTEAGLYSAILRSRVPTAKPFRRWVTHEVLPSIRKTGSYTTAPTPALTDDEIMHQALVISTQRVQALTATIEQQGARLALVEPKADAFDRWLSSNVDYPVAVVANALAGLGADMGRNRLFDWLEAARWIYRIPPKGQWHPRQEQIETRRLSVRLGKQLNTRSGEEFATYTVRITPKGAVEIGKRLGLLPEAVAAALDAETEAAA